MVRRGEEPSNEITVARAMSCLAVIFPLSFLSIGMVGSVPQWVAGYRGIEVQDVPYWISLIAFAVSTVVVFLIVPFGFLWHGRIRLRESLRFQLGRPAGYLAALLIGICMWPLLGQLVDSINNGIAFFYGNVEEPQWKKDLLEKARELVTKWRTVSPVLIVFCFSVVPAFCEEIFFRGVLLRAILPRNKAWVAIFLSALIFGVFHTLSLTDLSSQKFLPAFLAGIVLAWIAISVIFPWMISEPAGFPMVAVSPVMSIKSSINWKQRPRFSPHLDIFSISPELALASKAPVFAHASNIALVFPEIMSRYSSSVTPSLLSKPMSFC